MANKGAEKTRALLAIFLYLEDDNSPVVWLGTVPNQQAKETNRSDPIQTMGVRPTISHNVRTMVKFIGLDTVFYYFII
ncbi:hypothetical protein [Acidaminobacter hydrogenoformans]|uniref:Uncharacterized protein n=1 Tax=Acidaminobacter hydrogenoformans DSM 2784 TaxID=1120920 RepID=A0A1G5S5S3_9FIRM|nr:hypothetical protein [Acidaminobacter hydrogenoformans]SCZ81762.1 hypothetical protein SAMN03080599_03003 [Acidaminobacter hydrogenoformans DSM 2784]